MAAVLLLVTSYAPAIIRGSFDGNFQASCSGDSDSGDGSGLWSGDEEDWWLENITNGTELCSGVMDSNSSDFIYSHPEDSTSGNNSFCESIMVSVLHAWDVNQVLWVKISHIIYKQPLWLNS